MGSFRSAAASPAPAATEAARGCGRLHFWERVTTAPRRRPFVAVFRHIPEYQLY